MAMLQGGNFLDELCKILGEDPKKVRRVIIDARINDVTIVNIERYLYIEEASEIEKLTKLVEYQVVNSPNQKDETTPDICVAPPEFDITSSQGPDLEHKPNTMSVRNTKGPDARKPQGPIEAPKTKWWKDLWRAAQ